jgi:lipopolysaccharide biosynthesis glycosyltransferase
MSSSLSTQTRCSYITVLSTDRYIEGVLVLDYSLRQTQSKYPFLVLTTPNLSDRTYQILNQHGISYRPIAPIVLHAEVQARQQHWQWTYAKLQIFNQVQFDKLVYLDADMLICQNIDELFTKPHLSAVNAGGMLPENSTWKQLNSGLMVIEPAFSIYDDMMAKLAALYKPSGGDQDFLHAYYPDWADRPELHLDHTYNVFHTHLDRYHQLFGYELVADRQAISRQAISRSSIRRPPVKVIHFIGEYKPWLIKAEITQASTSVRKTTSLQLKDVVKKIIRSVQKRSPQPLRQRFPNVGGTRLKRQALKAWLECYEAMASETIAIDHSS